MGEEIDPSVIKKTQDILGSVIRKPVLTEKSLKKPPFRFLHDIITNVIKTSGFFKGLYTSEELQSENVKDKDNKILFLQKAIDVLALVTNQPVNLKPSKVVAGHDPQKTNLFLQILGTAVKNKLDSKEAVEKVVSGKAQTSPTKAPKDRRASVDRRTKQSSDKSHTRSLTKTLDPVKKTPKDTPAKTRDANEKTAKTKDGSEKAAKDPKTRERSKDRSKHKSEEKKTRDKVAKVKDATLENFARSSEVVNGEVENHVEAIDEPSTSMVNGNGHEREDLGESENGDLVGEKPSREKSHRAHSSRSTRPPSARSKRTKPIEENGSTNEVGSREPLKATLPLNSVTTPSAEDSFENMLLPSFRPPSARPPSARPSSSRPAPPRIRVRNVVENEEPVLRPTTAKPVENVILDQGHVSDEEEDTFIVMESEATENIEVKNTSSLPAATPEEDKGSLVKKLLETKKDLEGGSQQSPTRKVEIDRSQARPHQSASKELSALRTHVQSLSRTAVPLGRMLDFLQEDLDSMRMELRIWREEHQHNLMALHKEQSATESLLEPLQAQLDDLEQVVQNQLDANSALKASIARNDDRIQRMLSSVNSKS